MAGVAELEAGVTVTARLKRWWRLSNCTRGSVRLSVVLRSRLRVTPPPHRMAPLVSVTWMNELTSSTISVPLVAALGSGGTPHPLHASLRPSKLLEIAGATVGDGCCRRHLASAGCRSRWQARPSSAVELFLPGIGRGRCSGVGGFGCLAEVDDGHSGNANTARTPGGGRGRRPSDVQQPHNREPANAGQYEVAPQPPSSECLRADDRGPIRTPRVIAHGGTLFFPGARLHGYRL